MDAKTTALVLEEFAKMKLKMEKMEQQAAKSSPDNRSINSRNTTASTVSKSNKVDASSKVKELEQRAKDMNIKGRSAMNKNALIDAINGQNAKTRDELYHEAKALGIKGLSSAKRDQLISALNNKTPDGFKKVSGGYSPI